MEANPSMKREISCRVTRTLLMYVRGIYGSLGNLLAGLELDEDYLSDTNNWVSHEFLHVLYARMTEILGDKTPVYKMALASKQYQSLGLLDWIARLLGNPKLIYTQAPKYNKLLKANGDVYIHEVGDSWVVLEDRYHDSAQKTRHDCDYTRGILAGIPTIFDMPLAEVEEIECQVTREKYGERPWSDNPVYGSGGCLYRVSWDSKKMPSLWKRIFWRYNVYKKAIDDLQETNRIIQEKYDEVKKLAGQLGAVNEELRLSKQQLESYMAELQSSESRYRLLAENVSDTIWVMSLTPLRFTYISPSVEMMRGYTVEEAMAMTLEETLLPESLERVSVLLEETLAQEKTEPHEPEKSATLEIQVTCKDGSSTWAEISVSFLRDEKGTPVGLLGVTRDISERKRSAEFYQAKIAAEAANAAKSKFLSNMSHELRTPLNHIMGFTELLLEQNFGELNKSQAEYLHDIYQSSNHLLSLINEMLDISKIEAGKLELQTAEISVQDLLEQSIRIISDKTRERHISLSFEIAQIPKITADAVRFKQILYNLLSNAVKFTEEGGRISVKARVVADAERKNRAEGECGRNAVEIAVMDNGIGLEAQNLGKIFEPFSQVKNPLSGKYPGTGLGLSLTKKLVEMHGGRIWAESEGLGKGAAFRFTLPLP